MLNPLITGNARKFVLEIWPIALTLGSVEYNTNCTIEYANQVFAYIISNKIRRSQAFDSWRYTIYLSDNAFNFIQELIWSNCYPIL